MGYETFPATDGYYTLVPVHQDDYYFISIYPNAFGAPNYETKLVYNRPKAKHTIYNNSAFISEKDIMRYFWRHEDYRIEILDEMISNMYQDEFYAPAYDDLYNKLCSPKVKEQMSAFASNNPDNKLKGWQIFKPTLGADESMQRYNIRYEGNDWFSISNEDAHTTRIKLVAVGPRLRPLIVGVKNPAFAIDMEDNNKKLRSKYKELTIRKPIARTFQETSDALWLAKVCEFIHTHHKKANPQSNIVTEQDFSNIITAIRTDGTQFIQEFFGKLADSDISARKQRGICRLVCSRDIMKKIVKAGTAQRFFYGEKSLTRQAINIAHLENDWFTISTSPTDAPFAKIRIRRYFKPNSFLITWVEQLDDTESVASN